MAALTRIVLSDALPRQLSTPVTVTRIGQFFDPRYGEFEITRAMLLDMVRNFTARTYGQDIFLDVAHQPDNGAAGKVTRLWVEGDRLLADVEWTPYGREAIQQRGYQYLSAEYCENYIDNERRQPHGALLLGAALTIRPVIKQLDPIRLSESTTAIHHLLAAQFQKEAHILMKKHLEDLLKRLADCKLAQPVIDQLGEAFSAAAKTLGEDDKALADLAARLLGTGKKLAETLGAQPATIHLSITPPTPATPPEKPADPPPKALSEDDIRKLFAHFAAEEAQKNKQLAESLATLKTQFRSLIDAAPGLKSLSEAERTLLLGAETVIQPGMTAEQVKALAEHQIKLGDQMAVTKQLAHRGYPIHGVGSMHIDLGVDQAPKRLQEMLDRQLRESLHFGNGKLRLTEEAKLKPVVKRVLAIFDHTYAARLSEEARRLADGGDTTTSNISVPAGFHRTVIREALSDLNILDLVQMLTDPIAQATTQIPYELRRPGTILNDGIVYESAEIPRASIEQRMDIAYVSAMKLSLKVSNEVMHFSQASLIDWDAYGRNVESNSRLMREMVCLRIANEMQRSADAYSATAVTGESLTTLLNGSHSLIKTTYWPIVRPFQLRNLEGGAIGSVQNPIAVSVNGSAISQWDGSGTQSAGTYWTVENYNLGYVRLVDESGDPVTPTYLSGTTTISYSYATNVSTFDLKLASGEVLEDHLNGALRVLGARKALMSSKRFIDVDFQLMSPTLNDVLTNARQFAAEAARAGSGLTNSGNLATVKGIPAYGTNAPGIDLGDERILMGQRDTLSYVIVKPFITGQPFEAVGATGRPTGEKVAYGEEYNSIWVPTPIRNRLTSVIVYDSDARTAAA